MNHKDLDAMTKHWHSETNWLNDKVDEAFKKAQDHAYALGLARGMNARLTDEQILKVAEPFGEFQHGDAQGHKRIAFAQAILAAAVRAEP